MSGAPTSPPSRCGAAFFTWWRSWTGPAGMCWLGVCRTPWMRASAQTRSTRCWPAMARRRSSIPTRAASSPASPSPGACGRPASGSRWTAGAGAWTTSSLSGCGARSNTRPSICASSPTASRPGASSASGSTATTPRCRTRRSAGKRRPRPTAATRLWIMMDQPLRALPTSPQAQQQRQGDRFKGILAAGTTTGIHLH